MAINYVKGIKNHLRLCFCFSLFLITLFVLQNPLVTRAAVLYDLIGEDKTGLTVTSFNTEPFLIDKYDSLEVSCSLNSSVHSGGSYWPCSASCVLMPQGGSSGMTIINVSAQSVGSGTKRNSISVKDLTGYYYLCWTTSCFRASNGDWCSSVNVYKTKAYRKLSPSFNSNSWHLYLREND